MSFKSLLPAFEYVAIVVDFLMDGNYQFVLGVSCCLGHVKYHSPMKLKNKK